VWTFLGSQTPSTRSETCKNQQAMLAGKATHNNSSEEKLLLFRAKNFIKILMKNLYLNNHFTMLS
jgi:hypothetical protein